MAQTNSTTDNSPSYGYGLTQNQLIELVRTHHPNMLENEIRVYLNQALREFCKKTKILRGVFDKSVSEGVRWYTIDDEIVSINLVYFDNQKIERLLSPPDTQDLDIVQTSSGGSGDSSGSSTDSSSSTQGTGDSSQGEGTSDAEREDDKGDDTSSSSGSS